MVSIDGVEMSEGDRILFTGQKRRTFWQWLRRKPKPKPEENGIYEVASDPWGLPLPVEVIRDPRVPPGTVYLAPAGWMDQIFENFNAGLPPESIWTFDPDDSQRVVFRPDEVLRITIENPNKEEADMALTKHGEGSILPDSDQQKTAAKEAMDPKRAAALAKENEAADGDPSGS